MTFDEMMAELKRDYIKSLPEKMDTLKLHFDSQAVDELTNDFHKLKGTGKTYGLPEVSELGLFMEKLCREKPEQIPVALPLALQVLQDIYLGHTQDKSVDLKGIASFQSLLKLESP
jgi:HPt (histidine-containing phosphotransfer) domain-containing protein